MTAARRAGMMVSQTPRRHRTHAGCSVDVVPLDELDGEPAERRAHAGGEQTRWRGAATACSSGPPKRDTMSMRMWLSAPEATAPPTKVSQRTAIWMNSPPQTTPAPKALRATIWYTATPSIAVSKTTSRQVSATSMPAAKPLRHVQRSATVDVLTLLAALAPRNSASTDCSLAYIG